MPWSNTEQAWNERFVFAALLACAIALGWFSSSWSFLAWTLAWMGFLLVLLTLERFGAVHLVGPVLWYDLVRSSRRIRFFIVRTLYLGFVFLVLCMMYNTWSAGRGVHRPILTSEIAGFAQYFFITFLGVQFAVTVFLTPAYTAGAIAEEKERRTLEYVLATDLRNQEVVLGKLLARLAQLMLLLIAGLPVLSAIQFLGGVDPNLVLAGFGLTGLTLISLAGLSIFASVVARRARDAILLTYLLLIFYWVVCAIGKVLIGDPAIASFPSTPTWSSPVTAFDVVHALLSGHPVYAVRTLTQGGPSALTVLDVIRSYAIFHGAVFVLSIGGAMLLLRRCGLREKTAGKSRWQKGRTLPRIGDFPVLWREVHAEGGFFTRSRWAMLIVMVIVLVSLVPFGTVARSRWRSWSDDLNVWVRVVGTILASVMLIVVAVRAAGSVRGEYERDTMDSLLTTPLQSEDILYGKLIGSIQAPRILAWGLGIVWLMGVLGGGLSLAAVPLLIIAWCSHAAGLATLGLWISIACKTTLRATTTTLLVGIGLAFGHWTIWFCLGPCLFPLGGMRMFDWLFKLQLGFTPPVALGGFLAFQNDDFQSRWFGEMVVYAILGSIIWMILAVIFWKNANEMFTQETLRNGAVPERPDTPGDNH